MHKMPWIKLATGILRDEKIHYIIKKHGHDTIVFWVGLLTECKSGVLEMSEEVFCETCLLDRKRFDGIAAVFMQLGLVTRCNEMKLKVTNWEKYQFSDSYERVKAYRKRAVTKCNENETAMKRFETVEVEEEEERTILSPVVDYAETFMKFWDIWPRSTRKVARTKCSEQWRKCRLGSAFEKIAEHVEAMKTSKQWREGFEPAPLKYLKERRWEDGNLIDQSFNPFETAI